MFFYYDATYLLVLAGVVLCVAASANVNQTYKKYSTVGNARHMTAEQAARTILERAGISQVRIERVGGSLTDHYDPRNKVLRLSEAVYGSESVAAIGVAAHECGHAIQDEGHCSGGESRLCLMLALVPHWTFDGGTRPGEHRDHFVLPGGCFSVGYASGGV